MKVFTYAILKDYFDKEFVVDEQLSTIKELNDFLIKTNPDANTILSACRYAVKDSFVEEHFALHTDDTIHIMPPSSGG